MTPNRARRYLCIFVVLLTLLAIQYGHAQEIRVAPTGCPPGDGYVWFHDTYPFRPVGQVMWVQVQTERQFAYLCGAEHDACMLPFQDIGIVVARGPRWSYVESFVLHEECHASWHHTNSHPMKVTGSKFLPIR